MKLQDSPSDGIQQRNATEIEAKPYYRNRKNIFTTRQMKHVVTLKTDYNYHPNEIAAQYDVPVRYVYDTLSLIEERG